MLLKRVAELDKKESEIKKQTELYEKQYQQWREMMESQKKQLMKASTTNDQRTSSQLMMSVDQAGQDVEKSTEDLVKKLESAGKFQKILMEKEKILQDRVESLQKYLNIVEQQGMLPEAKHYFKLLKSAKRIGRRKMREGKCFISYAWNPDKDANEKLQKRLAKLKEDLATAGVETLLDIHNMEGGISDYMKDNIAQSARVLLICTPRLASRANEPIVDQKLNNLQIELRQALDRQFVSPKFIIPLIFEGERNDAVPQSVKNILYLDMTDDEKYRRGMVSLSPKGLIPMLLELENDKDYAEFLAGYQAKMQALLNCSK